MPLQNPNHFFVMTGLPRSGTTYLSAVLYNPPHVVTISDPAGHWQRFVDAHGKSEKILAEFEAMRASILEGEPILSLDGTPGFRGEKPVDTWNQPKKRQAVSVEDEFVLGLKNPEIFLEHLDVFLDAGLKCVVTLRHPVAVIASWIKKLGGDTPQGFADGRSAFYQSSQETPFERCLDLHEHLIQKILAHRDSERLRLIRYDEWFTRRDLLASIGEFAGIKCRDTLRPPPRRPSPVDLPRELQERILQRCVAIGALGFKCRDGRLEEPN